MHIVIIGGLPCTGKSTLARRLRTHWPSPLLCKDQVKECLFNQLGSSDRAWSRRLSHAAYEILFNQAEELAKCSISFMIEGNFRHAAHCDRFARLFASDASIIQVHCHADADTLVLRFRERAESGSRHAGHADRESLVEIEQEMRETRQAPLPIEGCIVDCDTTNDWSTAIDFAVEEVLARVGLEGGARTLLR